jgi:hypothetical protein
MSDLKFKSLKDIVHLPMKEKVLIPSLSLHITDGYIAYSMSATTPKGRAHYTSPSFETEEQLLFKFNLDYLDAKKCFETKEDKEEPKKKKAAPKKIAPIEDEDDFL